MTKKPLLIQVDQHVWNSTDDLARALADAGMVIDQGFPLTQIDLEQRYAVMRGTGDEKTVRAVQKIEGLSVFTDPGISRN